MESSEVVLIAISTILIGSADLFGGVAARRSVPLTIAAWSQGLGVPVLLIAAVIVGGVATSQDLFLGVLAGIGAAVGVSALYRGFTRAPVGVVAPVAATVAAVLPMLIGLLGGERPGTIAAFGLVLAVLAIPLVGYVPGGSGSAVSGVLHGVVSGLGFGAMVVAYAGTDPDSGLWSAVVGRSTAAALAAVAVVLLRLEWRVPRGAWRDTALAGLLAAVGMAAFVTVSQTAELVVLGVALGLFPVVTVLLAAVYLKERLRATQWLGVATAALAVTLISIG